MDLGLQGDIEKFTLPEILQLVATNRKNGTLGIQKDDSIIMVYFKEGRIIYGYGPRQTYHLGQLLKEKNIISDTQLEQAINIQAKSQNSRRLGEIMISRNFIDRSDLEKVVKKQVEELLYSLLSWNKGSFKFYENQFPTQEEITIEISVENVILEGLRRNDEQNMVKDVLPNHNHVYTISPAKSNRNRDVNMHAAEWNIMTLVDGHRTIKEICTSSSIDKNQALLKLAQLKLAGIITKAEPKDRSDNVKMEKMVNRLAGLFEDYLTEKGSTNISNSRLSKTYLEQKN